MFQVVHIISRLLLFRRLAVRDVHLLLVFLALGFPVVIDLLNGFIVQVLHSDFSLGILYRGLLLLIFLPFILVLKEFWVKIFLVGLLILWLLESVFWMETAMKYSVTNEVLIFSKLVYAWILYAYLSYARARQGISIEYMMQCLVFFGTMAGASILFSYLTGYGLSTYERTSVFAVKSYFNAQNDIGLTILLNLVFCMYFLVRYDKWIYAIYGILSLSGLILLGTRAGLVGGLMTVGAFTFLFMIGTVFLRNRSGIRVLLAGMMVSAVLALAFASYSVITQYHYLVNKYVNVLEETPRENLEMAASRRFKARDNLTALFGEGNTAFRVGVLSYYIRAQKQGAGSLEANRGKSVEQDIYDLIGSYGLVLGGLYLSVIILLFLKMLISFVIQRGLLEFTFIWSFALLLGHSFLAGHAMMSAVVAGPAAVIYLYAIENARLMKKKRYRSSHLIGAGVSRSSESANRLPAN